MINKNVKRIAKKSLNKTKKTKTTKLVTIVSFLLVAALALNLLQIFEPATDAAARTNTISKSNS